MHRTAFSKADIRTVDLAVLLTRLRRQSISNSYHVETLRACVTHGRGTSTTTTAAASAFPRSLASGEHSKPITNTASSACLRLDSQCFCFRHVCTSETICYFTSDSHCVSITGLPNEQRTRRYSIETGCSYLSCNVRRPRYRTRADCTLAISYAST